MYPENIDCYAFSEIWYWTYDMIKNSLLKTMSKKRHFGLPPSGEWPKVTNIVWGGRQSKRNGTNLWENEEMVGKICWVLRVDVNLSSGPPPHCCPFTLCVYIRDFPQIHCGYNKNFYVPGQELFLFLVTSFALSNWTISYFPLKVTEKTGNLETNFLALFADASIILIWRN